MFVQDGLVPERMSMQVLPVGGTYSAAEEARRLAEQVKHTVRLNKHWIFNDLRI